MPTVTADLPIRRFRLKSGSHHHDPGDGSWINIEPGGVFETARDMAALDPQRWQEIHEGGTISADQTIRELQARLKILEGKKASEDDLSNKSIKELREIAAGMDLDLSTCNGKVEIINTIREAMDAA